MAGIGLVDEGVADGVNKTPEACCGGGGAVAEVFMEEDRGSITRRLERYLARVGFAVVASEGFGAVLPIAREVLGLDAPYEWPR